jgi:enediyne polyketide synthase
LIGYESLSAFRVAAWIDAEPAPSWFGYFHRPDLVLGDLAALDAAWHVLLPCVPHRLALPVAVERCTIWQRPRGPMRVHAVERWHGDGKYRFDVDLVFPGGEASARWEGLLLRATGTAGASRSLPVELVGPWLSRRLLESGLGGPVDLVTPGVGDADGVLVDVPGGPVDAADPDASHLAVITARTGEGEAVAATRIRAARARLGASGGELELGRHTDDGLLEVCCDSRRAVTATMRVAGRDTVAVARVDGP